MEIKNNSMRKAAGFSEIKRNVNKEDNKLIAVNFSCKDQITMFLVAILFFGCTKKEDPVLVPLVTSILLSEITSETASSGGTITSYGGSDIVARGVCWGVSNAPTTDDSKTIDGTGTGNFTSLLTELLPSTTYYLRAYATNNLETYYGEELEFTTNETPLVQCTIPNGDFENFDTKTVNSSEGPLTYDLPQGWTESPLTNIPSRLNGIGFFNKYVESDANGNALLIRRSHPDVLGFIVINSGHIRFACDQVPNRLKGRVKFSASNQREAGLKDAFIIGAYPSTELDTLTTVQLYEGQLPPRAMIFRTEEPITTFTEFEIDLTEFTNTGVDYRYFTIMIKMEMLNNLSINPEYATAVLDDLRFEYD